MHLSSMKQKKICIHRIHLEPDLIFDLFTHLIPTSNVCSWPSGGRTLWLCEPWCCRPASAARCQLFSAASNLDEVRMRISLCNSALTDSFWLSRSLSLAYTWKPWGKKSPRKANHIPDSFNNMCNADRKLHLLVDTVWTFFEFCLHSARSKLLMLYLYCYH